MNMNSLYANIYEGKVHSWMYRAAEYCMIFSSKLKEYEQKMTRCNHEKTNTIVNI